MTITLIIIVTAMAALAIGFLLGRFNSSQIKAVNKKQKSPLPFQPPVSIPTDVKERVQKLVDDGHKIGAVKELHDATGIDLEEAKDIVDSMADSVHVSNNEKATSQARYLVRNGQKDEALELYRQASGMPLKEAKEVIDKMEKDFGADAH